MAKPISDQTAEERKITNARNGTPPMQASDFISSEVRLEVGLKIFSKIEVANFYHKHRAHFQQLAKDQVYLPQSEKQKRAWKLEAAARGIEFVDPVAPDLSESPTAWEIESFSSNPQMRGITQIVLRKAKDEWSYQRQTCLLYTSPSPRDS